MMKVPENTWRKTKSNNKLMVDITNVSLGYFFVRPTKSVKKSLKLLVQNGDSKVYYTICDEDKYKSRNYPLQFGSGNYSVTLYEKVLGIKYKKVGSVSFNVKLEDASMVYLYPNDYVQNCMLAEIRAHEFIGEEYEYPHETVAAIRNYIRLNYSYDYVAAAKKRGKSEEVPDIESCYISKMGICTDLAAMATCMLRSCGIPAKFVIGYADKNYHVWVKIFYDDKWVLYDPTADVTGNKAKKYVAERWY